MNAGALSGHNADAVIQPAGNGMARMNGLESRMHLTVPARRTVSERSLLRLQIGMTRVGFREGELLDLRMSWWLIRRVSGSVQHGKMSSVLP